MDLSAFSQISPSNDKLNVNGLIFSKISGDILEVLDNLDPFKRNHRSVYQFKKDVKTETKR